MTGTVRLSAVDSSPKRSSAATPTRGATWVRSVRFQFHYSTVQYCQTRRVPHVRTLFSSRARYQRSYTKTRTDLIPSAFPSNLKSRSISPTPEVADILTRAHGRTRVRSTIRITIISHSGVDTPILVCSVTIFQHRNHNSAFIIVLSLSQERSPLPTFPNVVQTSIHNKQVTHSHRRPVLLTCGRR